MGKKENKVRVHSETQRGIIKGSSIEEISTMSSKDVLLHLGWVKVIETSRISLIPFPFPF